MKLNIKLFLLGVLSVFALNTFAQTTITIAPDTNGKDAQVRSVETPSNAGNAYYFMANGWTWQGTPGMERSLMEFDLSSLPANAVVLSAKLKLYGDSNQWVWHNPLSGSNEAVLQRITSAWTEYGVTWNNQPTVTTAGEAYLKGSSYPKENYEVDITQMVIDAKQANQPVGMLLRLLNENYYRCLTFGSFDNPDVNKRPKLQITYVTGTDNCVTYNMNGNGKDATVFTLSNGTDANTNFGNDMSCRGSAWTYSGTAGTSRALMEYDFSSLPPGAVLTAAKLTLFCNTASWAKHSQQSGSNKTFLQRITSAWNESTVTWNNQPTTTTQNQVVLSPSASVTQNYPDINVLPIIRDGLAANQTSVGMMIRLETEQYYRSMHFLSGDSPDTTLFPFLTVCYFMPQVAVTFPNGGEKLARNVSYNITWTSTLVDTVNILYSADSGTTWATVASNVPASMGSYPWTPVSMQSVNYLIKVVNKKYTNIYDQSNAPFVVRNEPLIAVTSPNGGETWLSGSNKNITWTAAYSDSVKIDYSSDGGSTWNTISPAVSSYAGTFAWTVPTITSSMVKIRISDQGLPAYYDLSNANFTIQPYPTITLTSPNGGEVWLSGSSKNITWTSINSVNIKIDYSTDGSNWYTIAASVSASSGSYNWTVPNINSSTVKIRLTDVNYPVTVDLSDNNFTIRPEPSVTLTSPNGGETWLCGSTRSITWTSANSTNVKIDYTLDGNTWSAVVNSVASSAGTYSWTVPNVISATVKVRISDADFPSYNDASDNDFTIHPNPQFTVTSPNGGEVWYNNTSRNITWAASYSLNVKIEYSPDNGSTWNTIVAITSASSGSYNWTLPVIQSNMVLVKIRDIDFPSFSDQSDATFTISTPVVTVTSPNGGESWIGGSQHAITWTSGGVNLVNIDYSSDGGATWSNVASNISSSGSNTYTWTLPFTGSVNSKIRISDAGSSGASDQSDAVFSVIGSGVGIAKAEAGMVTVYPNPSSGTFVVVFPTETARELSITDLQGRLISVIQTNKQQTEIRMEHLAKGVYFLSSEGFRSKLIIQ